MKVNLLSKMRVSLLIMSALLISNTATSQITPTVAAPTPTALAGNVISLYSNAYTNVGVDTWLTSWSAAGTSTLQIAGNDTRMYTNVNFLGVETTAANLINAKCMTHFNMNMYTPNMTIFRIKLVDFGANGIYQGTPNDDVEAELTFTPTLNGWNTYNIPLSTFASAGLTTRGNIAQMIFSGAPVSTGTFYIDNVYYSKPALAVSNATICSGSAYSITTSGVSSFTVQGNPSGVVTPTANSGYTVVGTNSANCTSTGVLTVNVNPTPAITVTGNQTICLGQSTSLSAAGANTYTWSGGQTTSSVSLSPTITSQYSVSGTSTLGCSGTSTVSLNVQNCTNLSNHLENAGISLYPNPTNGQLKITLNNSDSYLITVVNAIGQVVVSKNAENTAMIDLSTFNDGVYYVSILNAATKTSFNTKVVKQ